MNNERQVTAVTAIPDISPEMHLTPDLQVRYYPSWKGSR